MPDRLLAVRLRLIFLIALATAGVSTNVVSGAAASAPAAPRSATTTAVVSQASAKAKALSDLRQAAARLHRAADGMTDGEVTVLESLRWQFALSEMRYALRQARKLGLNSAAKLYDAALARETYRVVFARFVRQATEYGRNVAENARQSNPRLTPGQVRQIEANASAWYGNSAVQKNLVASARKVGTKTYELTVKVKPGEDLDAAAYKVYRGLSVGARKTSKPYSG